MKMDREIQNICVNPLERCRDYKCKSLFADDYTVTLPDELNIHNTFYVKHLKPYIPNDNKRFPNHKNTKPGPLPEFEDEDRYEVE